MAVGQTTPRRGDVDANVEQHLRLVRIAADQQAQVLVFPELSLTGYELDLANDLAFSRSDSRLAPLVDAASSHAMTLVVGAPARSGPRLHLGAFIISPDRTVRLYTKHHLGAFPASASRDGRVPPAEATVFEPGDQNPLLRFGEDTAAVAVCADTGRPSHAREAANRGACAYLASVFVIPSDFEPETANLQARAMEHSLNVAMANFGGPSGGLASAGGSAIWTREGTLAVQLDAIGPGVGVAVEDRGGWRARAIMLST
jgi:predicted amidohydrolase